MTALCKRVCPVLAGTVLACAWAAGTPAQDAPDPLAAGFLDPPDSAKPRVWWHWMNGNITKEGIRLDLEWMHRVGIGGFQTFDASLGTPQVVDRRLVFMTPDWQDAFHYAMTLADQLGLEASIAGSPGWSESGGPWVAPADAMKKLVWSETRVDDGQHYRGMLPRPPAVSGPFQDIPIFDFIAAMMGLTPPPPPEYYADSVVIAYRVPSSEVPMHELKATVTSSGGSIDASRLDDGDLVQTVRLPIAPPGRSSWLQFAFAKPQPIQAMTLVLGGGRNPLAGVMGGARPGPVLEASDDGKTFRAIAQLPNDGAVQNTIAFPRVAARVYRLTFATPTSQPGGLTGFAELGMKGPPPPVDYLIAEAVLHSGARLHRAEEKAGFATLAQFDDLPTPAIEPADAIRRADIIDLTAKMRPDGTLDWRVPPGRWTVVRFGYSLTGVTNHPASPEGTGFEVDKLNAASVKKYMSEYLERYRSASGGLMGRRGLRCLVSDSFEAGAQNWTAGMIDEFTKRRGYDPRPWLPVLTGRVVESSEASDRFLWDFRRTLADLIAENHYAQISALLKERGLCHYAESQEDGRAFIGDGMQVKRSSDAPMGAMWVPGPGVNAEQFGYDADIRESASVAHLYGQNVVAAESLTSATAPWGYSPALLKPTADKELALGLNRFVIHTSVHQPLVDRRPGLGLGPFGQWFTRNETWAEPARAWVSYLSRSSYLLQQGHFVADVAYFYGEDSNVTALYSRSAPEVPSGYNYDFVNADALTNLLAVQDGALVTPSGMSYRALALAPRARTMSLGVLRRVAELAAAGAVIVGPKPTASLSLGDDEAEFREIADRVWDSHRFRVYDRQSLADAMRAEGVAPDFEYSKPQADTNLLFVHRRLADGDVYFVNNRNGRDESLDATFRVGDREPEFWHADSGVVEPASYRISGGRTQVMLKLAPWDAVFVVFRKPASALSRMLPSTNTSTLADLAGPWELRFPPDRGAPPTVMLDRLVSWTENADEGVKYFSGTARYVKSLRMPRQWLKPGVRLLLDLGDVENLAEVSVNGKSIGIVWKRPFHIDVTDALQPGDNRLEIAVTNLWVNRLIGDRQPAAKHPYTFSVPAAYKADSPLRPSGLMGPVRLLAESEAKN